MTTGENEAATVVRLEGVPARLFLESQDHQHDVIRELQLIELGDRFSVSRHDVPAELARLIAEILSRYDDVRSATRAQALAAIERGDDEVNLDVPVREGMGEALRRWLALIEEVDSRALHGEMLVLAARPEIRRLRRWYVDELVRRLES